MTKREEFEDLFGDLSQTGRTLSVTIDTEAGEKELSLKMDPNDLYALMTLGQTGVVKEDEVESLNNALRSILYRSYLPYYDTANDRIPNNLTDEQEQENEEAKDMIEGLLVRHYLEIFTGITKELGWQDEQEIEQRMQEAKKKRSQPGL